jgi:hypothetical protein
MKLLSILFTSLLYVYAAEFSGTGFGPTIKVAKQEALSDLSQSIKAEVKSTFSNSQNLKSGRADKTVTSNIVVSSNLPIIGAEFELFDNRDNVEALVELSPKKAKVLYKKRISQLSKEIYTLDRDIKKAKKPEIKVVLLQKLLQNLKEFDRYYSVGVILGLKDIKTPDITKASVENELLKLHNNIETLNQAAMHIAKTFQDYKNIYLYPPKVDNSHEITPFAKALSMKIKPYIDTASNLQNASYQLVGDYIYNKRGLILNYTLIDTNTHENIGSKTITIEPAAYKDYRVSSKTLSFDKLLHDGVVVSNSLRASITTNKGSEFLLFTEHEEIELLIKLNKMGYYYIVGYTQTAHSKHAYLLELNESQGDSRFKGFINADDVNHWISLGTFSVEAPFGIESLQLVTSNRDFKALPPHRFDAKSGYFLIGEGVTEGLNKTRGLIRKQSKKREISEAVLFFTTSKR